MDWKKIKAEYIAGGTSYRKLAEKYNVSFGTLRRVAEREGWTQKRAQVAHNVDTKIMETVSEDEAEKATNIIDVADKLLKKIYDMLDEDYNTQNIKNLTSALKDLKEIKGYKSAIDLKEQEARIAKLRKEVEDDTETDATVIVKFEEDISKWSQ